MMGEINLLATLVAALAAFLIGGIWYGPLFGKAWMAAVGKTEADIKQIGMVRTYGLSFLLALLAATMLGHLFARAGVSEWHIFMMISGGVAIAWVIPALWTNYLFQNAGAKLAFIDGGYWLCFYLAMGVVFGLFAVA